MRTLNQLDLQEAFERSARTKRQKAIEALLDDERRIDKRHDDEKLEREEQEAFEEAVLATSSQIAKFEERLDRYDTGIVEALMENRRALDQAQDRLADLDSRAFKLPDGRRAFRSQDGQRVFDETGAKLGRDIVDPAAIGDDKPTWEAWTQSHDDAQRLAAERDRLISFQTRVDQAREQGRQDGVTQADLQALDDDLDRAMPDAVRQKVKAPGRDGKLASALSDAEIEPDGMRIITKAGTAARQPTPTLTQ